MAGPSRASGMPCRRAVAAALLGAALLGCAHVETRVDDLDPDEAPGFLNSSKSRGIRYYDAAVFLLVHTDNKGGIVVRTLILPDTTRRMSAEPREFLASCKATMTFKDGVLASTSETTAAEAVPKELIGAAKAVLSSLYQARAAGFRTLEAERKPPSAPGIYLFRLRADRSSGTTRYLLCGAQGDPIEVPAPAAKGAP